MSNDAPTRKAASLRKAVQAELEQRLWLARLVVALALVSTLCIAQRLFREHELFGAIPAFTGAPGQREDPARASTQLPDVQQPRPEHPRGVEWQQQRHLQQMPGGGG